MDHFEFYSRHESSPMWRALFGIRKKYQRQRLRWGRNKRGPRRKFGPLDQRKVF